MRGTLRSTSGRALRAPPALAAALPSGRGCTGGAPLCGRLQAPRRAGTPAPLGCNTLPPAGRRRPAPQAKRAAQQLRCKRSGLAGGVAKWIHHHLPVRLFGRIQQVLLAVRAAEWRAGALQARGRVQRVQRQRRERPRPVQPTRAGGGTAGRPGILYHLSMCSPCLGVFSALPWSLAGMGRRYDIGNDAAITFKARVRSLELIWPPAELASHRGDGAPAAPAERCPSATTRHRGETAPRLSRR